MIKKALVAAAAVLILMAAPAAAQYPIVPDDPNTISDTTVVWGQSVTVTFDGYAAEVPITFTVFSEPIHLGTATSDAEGKVAFTFEVPYELALGVHRIEAAGTGADGGHLAQSLSFTVVASDDGTTPATGADASSGTLARTGSDTDAPLRLAAGLVAAGGLFLLVARRRRQHSNA